MRRVFYSFHYEKDNWRVQQIREMHVLDGTRALSPNKWEELKRSGSRNIQKWIDNNLQYRSCTIVLIGEETANRDWVLYEIKRSWELGKGLIGIYIHNLKDSNGRKSQKGKNPFEKVIVDGIRLDTVVPVYDPVDSWDISAYQSISENISKWVEIGIASRNRYKWNGVQTATLQKSTSISQVFIPALVGSAMIVFGIWAFCEIINGHKEYSCPHCNTKIQVGTRCCPTCGTYLEWEDKKAP